MDRGSGQHLNCGRVGDFVMIRGDWRRIERVETTHMRDRDKGSGILKDVDEWDDPDMANVRYTPAPRGHYIHTSIDDICAMS